MLFFILILISILHITLSDYLYHDPWYYQLNAYTCESDDFRSMDLGSMFSGDSIISIANMTDLMISSHFHPTVSRNPLSSVNGAAARYMKPVEYQKLKRMYDSLFQNIIIFPIPANAAIIDTTFENTWMETRTYGGVRGHEGCDIMGNRNVSGYYPVVSMSDGIIEKIGWLEKGGWRIGIRTSDGLYLYYAHLHHYADHLRAGMPVHAGQLLGYMGSSGYSKIEGTSGNFDVHLHIGIYIQTDHYEELSINPYWILYFLKNYRQLQMQWRG